jgi:hypothetical protein
VCIGDATTLRITTFSITTLSIVKRDAERFDAELDVEVFIATPSVVMLNVNVLSVVAPYEREMVRMSNS